MFLNTAKAHLDAAAEALALRGLDQQAARDLIRALRCVITTVEDHQLVIEQLHDDALEPTQADEAST